jgi:hypothetical protein
MLIYANGMTILAVSTITNVISGKTLERRVLCSLGTILGMIIILYYFMFLCQ